MLRRLKSNKHSSSAEASPKKRRLRLAGSAAIVAAAVGVIRRVRNREASTTPIVEPPSTGKADWPPLNLTKPNAEPSAATVGLAAGVGLGEGPRPVVADAHAGEVAEHARQAPWVEPDDGQCPLSHPVKGNASSQIYHVPESRFYDMTIAERCYRDAEAAEADGMRAPKR